MQSDRTLRSRSRSRSQAPAATAPEPPEATTPRATSKQRKSISASPAQVNSEHDAFTSFILKPHTVTVLVLGLALVLYMAFFYPAAEMSVALKRGFAAMAFIFLAYCGVQLRDSMLVRPHPAVW